jgi:hypothetical protein
MREYDDERELMGYVWRNYPQIVRPHQCVPSAERVRDELPPELRAEYWQHAVECQRLINESRDRDERASGDGRTLISMPILPEMRPELLAAVSLAHGELEKQEFWNRFLPHKDQVSIHRCARCKRILVNEKSRQCLWCGYNWHRTRG